MARRMIINSRNLTEKIVRRLESQIISLHSEVILAFSDPVDMDVWDSEHRSIYDEIKVLAYAIGLEEEFPFRSPEHMLEVAEMLGGAEIR